jgi:hypothetical protein
MKFFKIIIVISFVFLAACAKQSHDLHDENGNTNWPVSIIPWENVLNKLDSAEVVILCLVDSYNENDLKNSDRHSGPTWLPAKKHNNLTPAEVLEGYLKDVRRLGEKDALTPSGSPDPKKMAILIVECGKETRERAGQLFSTFGVHHYDYSIPVIYVLHNKKLITSYTYTGNPGKHGEKLRAQVDEIFKTKSNI